MTLAAELAPFVFRKVDNQQQQRTGSYNHKHLTSLRAFTLLQPSPLRHCSTFAHVPEPQPPHLYASSTCVGRIGVAPLLGSRRWQAMVVSRSLVLGSPCMLATSSGSLLADSGRTRMLYLRTCMHERRMQGLFE